MTMVLKNCLACTLTLCVILIVAFTADGFTSHPLTHQQKQQLQQSTTARNGIFDKVGEMFEELDAFVDDATSRRLGNGASFYGKRKSGFYGKNDKSRKTDRNVQDRSEDYEGPSSSGYFQWMPDESGQMRPVTRMKKKIVEKKTNPKRAFWERAED